MEKKRPNILTYKLTPWSFSLKINFSQGIFFNFAIDAQSHLIVGGKELYWTCRSSKLAYNSTLIYWSSITYAVFYLILEVVIFFVPRTNCFFRPMCYYQFLSYCGVRTPWLAVFLGRCPLKLKTLGCGDIEANILSYRRWAKDNFNSLNISRNGTPACLNF